MSFRRSRDGRLVRISRGCPALASRATPRACISHSVQPVSVRCHWQRRPSGGGGGKSGRLSQRLGSRIIATVLEPGELGAREAGDRHPANRK